MIENMVDFYDFIYHRHGRRLEIGPLWSLFLGSCGVDNTSARLECWKPRTGWVYQIVCLKMGQPPHFNGLSWIIFPIVIIIIIIIIIIIFPITFPIRFGRIFKMIEGYFLWAAIANDPVPLMNSLLPKLNPSTLV